jgi:hypothetical protein
MKKIWISILVIILTVGIVSGSAFAVFSNKAEVKGFTMSSGNADLKIGATGMVGEGCIWPSDTGGKLCDSITNYGTIDNIYPGYLVGDYFRLRNASDSEISLNVEAGLSKYADTSGYGGSWSALKNKIQARVIEYSGKNHAEWAFEKQNFNESKATNDTGWHYMEWWSNKSPQITSNPIAKDSERHFVLWIRVVDSAGNEIADKSVDLNLEFNGEQAL